MDKNTILRTDYRKQTPHGRPGGWHLIIRRTANHVVRGTLYEGDYHKVDADDDWLISIFYHQYKKTDTMCRTGGWKRGGGGVGE